MERDEMKRKRVRTPAGPMGNQDQNRPGLAIGREMSQHAARPTRAALVKRLCNEGVRKSRYGRAVGGALTGAAGGFMAFLC
jgi:N-formylglutamate amidohydrolase